jgi:hypothetical protein
MLDKFESRSDDGIFFGYASLSRAYHVLNLETNQIVETCEVTVNTKICHRKESELWAQLGDKIRPEEGRFLQKDSARGSAVSNLLPFGKETVCADFVGLPDDVARAEGTNGWISDRT